MTMQPYEPLDDIEKRSRGQLAGSRGGGFAEIINQPRKPYQFSFPKKKRKQLRKSAKELEMSGGRK